MQDISRSGFYGLDTLETLDLSFNDLRSIDASLFDNQKWLVDLKVIILIVTSVTIMCRNDEFNDELSWLFTNSGPKSCPKSQGPWLFLVHDSTQALYWKDLMYYHGPMEKNSTSRSMILHEFLRHICRILDSKGPLCCIRFGCHDSAWVLGPF